MAQRKSMLKEEFVSKKGEDDVPIEACKGWVDPCDFCDKRFGNWLESSDEVLEKIPSKPGIVMVGLKSKNVTEVMDIILECTDIQKSTYSSIDILKERVADKKSKSTKSTILCRWMNFKSQNEKDVISLCAHWFNQGELPRQMTSWPGNDLMQISANLEFSEKIQKWCHPRKDAVWRKAKAAPSKLVEVVVECDFENSCEICDSNFGFSAWKPVADVINDNLAPDKLGVYQASVRYGKKREVVYIGHDSKEIKLNIKGTLKNNQKWLESVLRNEKFKGKNAYLEVRWVEIKDTDNDNSCFLYAHWLNAERFPILMQKMPGERQLEKHKSFVLRVNDKKWCYELDVFKQSRLSKFKTKKIVLDDLQDDIRYMHCSDD